MDLIDIKQLPNNLDFEKLILCALIIDNDLMLTCELKPDDFYEKPHQIVYQAMQKLKTFDVLSLNHELNIGDKAFGLDYIYDLASYSLAINMFEQHQKKLKQLSKHRKIIYKSQMIIAKSYSEMDCSQDLSEMININTETIDTKTSLLELMIDVIDNKDINSIISKTGYELLDGYIGGLNNTDLVVIAGRSSDGKSSLAMNIINNVLPTQKVSLHTFEVSRIQVAKMMVGLISGYGSSKQKFLKPDEVDKAMSSISAKSEHINNLNIYTTNKFDKVINQIRRDSIDGVKIHVIDHVGLIDTGMENRVQSITKITGQLKALCQEYGICIIVLSQINREGSKKQGDYDLSDLRDSGSIEQDANIVLFVYRDDADKQLELQTINIKIGKNRFGKSQVYIPLQFISCNQIIKG